MRLLSHLNVKEFPFHIPNSFYQSFLVKDVLLEYDPFSSSTGEFSIPLQDMKSSVTYSLNEPLAKTFTLKSYHSNVVVKAFENPPEADAHYIIASFSNLSSFIQGKKYLGIQTADCLAVVFCFENKDYFIGAVSHAGWRGYSTGMLQNTIEKLKDEAFLLGISSDEVMSSLKIHIAPAIFGVSYECGEEVKKALCQHGEKLFLKYPEMQKYFELYQKLINVYQDNELNVIIHKLLLENQQSHSLSEKIFPDLQLLAALECVVSGIQQSNIEILRENTYNHPTLFSFREETHKKSAHTSFRQWTHLRFPVTDE